MAKTETEMEEVFQKKVTEKIARIEATQIELETKSKEAKEKLESEKKELEQKRRAFLEEKRGELGGTGRLSPFNLGACFRLGLMG